MKQKQLNRDTEKPETGKPNARKIFDSSGKPSIAYPDTEHKRAIKRAKRKYARRLKKANYRAKFGPRGLPAPVVTRRIDE